MVIECKPLVRSCFTCVHMLDDYGGYGQNVSKRLVRSHSFCVHMTVENMVRMYYKPLVGRRKLIIVFAAGATDG